MQHFKKRYTDNCNIYVVQQDTQSVLRSEFYSELMLARHVSELTGPSSGAFIQAVFADFGMCCNTKNYFVCAVIQRTTLYVL